MMFSRAEADFAQGVAVESQVPCLIMTPSKLKKLSYMENFR